MTTDKRQSLHRNKSPRFSSWKMAKPTRAPSTQITRPDITAAQCHRMRGDDCSALISEQSTIRRMQEEAGGIQRQQSKAKSDTADAFHGRGAKGGMIEANLRRRGRQAEESVPLANAGRRFVAERPSREALFTLWPTVMLGQSARVFPKFGPEGSGRVTTRSTAIVWRGPQMAHQRHHHRHRDNAG
jgi:hypothetical protein